MNVLRILKIEDTNAPAKVEEVIALLNPEVVVGPEWARILSCGRIFVPRPGCVWLTRIKRAFMREFGASSRFDETRV